MSKSNSSPTLALSKDNPSNLNPILQYLSSNENLQVSQTLREINTIFETSEVGNVQDFITKWRSSFKTKPFNLKDIFKAEIHCYLQESVEHGNHVQPMHWLHSLGKELKDNPRFQGLKFRNVDDMDPIEFFSLGMYKEGCDFGWVDLEGFKSSFSHARDCVEGELIKTQRQCNTITLSLRKKKAEVAKAREDMFELMGKYKRIYDEISNRDANEKKRASDSETKEGNGEKRARREEEESESEDETESEIQESEIDDED